MSEAALLRLLGLIEEADAAATRRDLDAGRRALDDVRRIVLRALDDARAVRTASEAM